MKFDPRSRRGVVVGVLASIAAVAIVTGAIFLFKPYVPVLSLGVLYVFAVLPVAVVWGLWLALPVSVASMLAFNWFFLPPVHTFTLAQSENWFALAVYLATAVVVSELAARARRRAASAEQRERESALLAQLATELLGGRELEEELDEVASRAAQVLGVEEATIELGPPRRPPAGSSPHPLEAADRAVGTIYVPEGSDPHVAARHRFLPRSLTLTSRPGTASCPRSPRCSPSPWSATGWSARRWKPRRCAAATSSRRRSCAPSPTICARR